jgi:hypothetical protein
MAVPSSLVNNIQPKSTRGFRFFEAFRKMTPEKAEPALEHGLFDTGYMI